MDKQTEYRVARPEERADMIDFANYVFSQAHQPHNFKTLLPKTYADDAPDFSSWHFLALQEGRIRALVSCRPTELYLGGNKLSCGCVGTVSVHPYSRGEGHMKKLMEMLLDDCKKRDYDMVFLGGQRQRYGYFGFEPACICSDYVLTPNSVRHALENVDDSEIGFTEITDGMEKELDFAWELANTQVLHGGRSREDFLRIMHSWNQKLWLVTGNDMPLGYVMGDGCEIVLKDETQLPCVLKALQRRSGKNLTITVAPHDTGRIKLLEGIYDSRRFHAGEMVNVLNWKNTLNALLSLKASYMRLNDMKAELDIDGEKLTIQVNDNVPSVIEGGNGEIKLTKLEAERLMFGMERAFLPDERFGNVLPLPLYIGPADTY